MEILSSIREQQQRILVLSKSSQWIEQIQKAPLLHHVVFYICQTTEDTLGQLTLEPDVFLTYEVTKQVVPVLQELRRRKHEMKPCNALSIYKKHTERKILLNAGGRDFLREDEAFSDLGAEGLLVRTLDQTLGMVVQQRYYQEVTTALVDLVEDKTELPLHPIFQDSKFFQHLQMGIKALSQEFYLYESQLNQLKKNIPLGEKKLTQRQTQVCQLIALEGFSNKEVANYLSNQEGKTVSVRTIDRHREEINRKLGKNKLVWIQYLQDTGAIDS